MPPLFQRCRRYAAAIRLLIDAIIDACLFAMLRYVLRYAAAYYFRRRLLLRHAMLLMPQLLTGFYRQMPLLPFDVFRCCHILMLLLMRHRLRP